MKILYLEDDTDLADTIEEFLQDKNFDVVVVHDGEEGLNASFNETFDLFIFDIQCQN